jgi:hydrogenase maturation protease
MTASGVRVIGVGSPFGDDWVGWELAERLRASEALAPWRDRVSVSLQDRPGAALLQAWRGGGMVILLDAVRSGAAPGTVHRFSAAELVGRPRQLSTHGFGVADAVQLAATLDALPESLLFIGVEVDPAHREMCLSEAVHAALPALVAEIESLMRSWLQANPLPHE